MDRGCASPVRPEPAFGAGLAGECVEEETSSPHPIHARPRARFQAGAGMFGNLVERDRAPAVAKRRQRQ